MTFDKSSPTFFTSNRFLLALLLAPLGTSTSIAAAITNTTKSRPLQCSCHGHFRPDRVCAKKARVRQHAGTPCPACVLAPVGLSVADIAHVRYG